MQKVVDACKQHPMMAILQAITVAALTFVGTQLWNMNRELGELRVKVELMEVRLRSIDDWRERSIPAPRQFPSELGNPSDFRLSPRRRER